MAVPFSRPAYTGHYRARQARAQQQQQQQQQQNQAQQHPITRFLDGRGGIRLDQLSLTSRIAFYALYEAYRLLVDLTNTDQGHQQQQQHTVVHTQQEQEQREQPEVVVLPDVVPQADSTQSHEPRVHRRQQHQQHHQHHSADSDKWIPEQQPDLIPENDDETDYCLLPDFVPRQQNEQRITREDLEIKVQRVQQRSKRFSTSSDYFSLDGSQVDFDDQSEVFEEDDDTDEVDHDPKCFVNKGINWHNLGNQLCEIASAFEVTYAPAMTEQQRQIYGVYRDLKLKSLALSRRDKTMVGLAKTICRQVLLSTIWTLLKKIM